MCNIKRFAISLLRVQTGALSYRILNSSCSLWWKLYRFCVLCFVYPGSRIIHNPIRMWMNDEMQDGEWTLLVLERCLATCFWPTLQWRVNEHDGVSNHRHLDDGLLHRLFRCRSKKTCKLRVTGFCEGNSSMTGEFPAQRASNAEQFPSDDAIMHV